MKFLARTNLVVRLLSIISLLLGIVGMNNSGPYAELAALYPLMIGVMAFGVLNIISMIISTILDIHIIKNKA